MTTPENPPPDIVVGHHPDLGIVATNTRDLAASAWMLRGFDFHPVPGRPGLYALADPERDGPQRATRAVDLLRRADYRVDTDIEFDPALADPGPAADRHRSPRVEPDIAFAEHPRLGVVAATGDLCTAHGRQILDEHGWRHAPRLNVYVLPIATSRDQALGHVAQATVAMHRADLRVAVHPGLAQDVTTRRRPAPAADQRPDRSPDTARRTFPSLSAAALAASPARTGLPGTPPIPAPAAPAPAGSRPVDPRVAFSHTH